MVDLAKVEGLTPEQQAALSALFDSEVGGLKSKVEELLSEKKSVSAKAHETESALEEARKAALSAEEQKLMMQGKYEEAQALREKERAELVAKANAEAEKAKGALESMYRGTALNQAKSLIHDDYKDFTEARLERMIHLEYGEDGSAQTVYKDGDKVIATNVDEFKSWASEQPTWQKVLNGVNSSGAGTTQSSSGGATNGGKKYSEMSLQEQVAFNSSK